MLTDLEGVASLITKLSTNYHKVNKSRKTREYIEKQKAYVEAYWSEFVELASNFPSEEIEILVNETSTCYQSIHAELSEQIDSASTSSSASSSSSANTNYNLRSKSSSNYPTDEGEFAEYDEQIPKTNATNTKSKSELDTTANEVSSPIQSSQSDVE